MFFIESSMTINNLALYKKNMHLLYNAIFHPKNPFIKRNQLHNLPKESFIPSLTRRATDSHQRM